MKKRGERDFVRLFIFLGAVMMFFAVGLGAFGAHGLKGKIADDLLAIYQTGVQYQMVHGIGLLLVGLWLNSRPAMSGWVVGAGWFLLIGILLFSGSLYAITFTGHRPLGMITPFGGFAFLIGWLLLAYAALKQPIH